MTQIVNELLRTRSSAGPYTYKQEELIRNVKAGGNLSCSDHEIVEFSIPRRGKKQKAGSWPQTSVEKFMTCAGICSEEFCSRWLWREGSRKGAWLSRMSCSKLKNGSSQKAGNQANMAENLNGWTRSSWQNSNTKKQAYRRWKQGQVTQEEYRDIIQICRNEIRKVKAQLEVTVARDLMSIKYISSNRKTREWVGLLLNGNLVRKDK